MKATHTILQSDRYLCAWSENPDRDPPPGRELAQDLLQKILIAGGNPASNQRVGDSDWEHSSWFFIVRWLDCEYQIDVEPSATDSLPPTWHIGIARVRGVWRSLFGSRDFRFEVDDGFMQIVASSLETIAACGTVAWITEDQAVEKLWGRLPTHGASIT
jgi:hypothetical protein